MVVVTTWLYWTLGLTIFAIILLMIGVFTPYWIYLDVADIEVGVGLLYRFEDNCVLDDNENCLNAPSSFLKVKYDNPSTHDETHWDVLTGFEMTGAIMGLILLAMLVFYIVVFSSKMSLNFFNILLTGIAVLTWILVGGGLIVFAVYHGDAMTEAPEISERSFSWSALLCFISAIILIFVSIFIRSCCRRDDYITQAIPASFDSKMNLYPSTKNAQVNRYFAPSVYREEHFQGLSNGLDQDRFPNPSPEFFSEGMVPPPSPFSRRPISIEYENRGFERAQEEIMYNNRVESDHRRLTTEVVLDRKGQAQDLDNEYSDVIIYKGRDNVRKVEDFDPNIGSGRLAHLGNTSGENLSRSQRDGTFHYSAQHLADTGAHRGDKYMVHTGESYAGNKRLVLSPNNFTDASVKYNPSYSYRPYSEQVY